MLSLRGLEVVGPAGVLEELEEEEDPDLEDCFLKLGDPKLEYLLSFWPGLLALSNLPDCNTSS